MSQEQSNESKKKGSLWEETLTTPSRRLKPYQSLLKRNVGFPMTYRSLNGSKYKISKGVPSFKARSPQHRGQLNEQVLDDNETLSSDWLKGLIQRGKDILKDANMEQEKLSGNITEELPNSNIGLLLKHKRITLDNTHVSSFDQSKAVQENHHDVKLSNSIISSSNENLSIENLPQPDLEDNEESSETNSLFGSDVDGDIQEDELMGESSEQEQERSDIYEDESDVSEVSEDQFEEELDEEQEEFANATNQEKEPSIIILSSSDEEEEEEEQHVATSAPVLSAKHPSQVASNDGNPSIADYNHGIEAETAPNYNELEEGEYSSEEEYSSIEGNEEVQNEEFSEEEEAESGDSQEDKEIKAGDSDESEEDEQESEGNIDQYDNITVDFQKYMMPRNNNILVTESSNEPSQETTSGSAMLQQNLYEIKDNGSAAHFSKQDENEEMHSEMEVDEQSSEEEIEEGEQEEQFPQSTAEIEHNESKEAYDIRNTEDNSTVEHYEIISDADDSERQESEEQESELEEQSENEDQHSEDEKFQLHNAFNPISVENSQPDHQGGNETAESNDFASASALETLAKDALSHLYEQYQSNESVPDYNRTELPQSHSNISQPHVELEIDKPNNDENIDEIESKHHGKEDEEHIEENKDDNEVTKETTPASDASWINEPSVYFSVDESIHDIQPEIKEIPKEKSEHDDEYEVIVSNSVYSTSSQDDNAQQFPAADTYMSPFDYDPFNSVENDEEAKLKLQETLALLDKAGLSKQTIETNSDSINEDPEPVVIVNNITPEAQDTKVSTESCNRTDEGEKYPDNDIRGTRIEMSSNIEEANNDDNVIETKMADESNVGEPTQKDDGILDNNDRSEIERIEISQYFSFNHTASEIAEPTEEKEGDESVQYYTVNDGLDEDNTTRKKDYGKLDEDITLNSEPEHMGNKSEDEYVEGTPALPVEDSQQENININLIMTQKVELNIEEATQDNVDKDGDVVMAESGDSITEHEQPGITKGKESEDAGKTSPVQTEVAVLQHEELLVQHEEIVESEENVPVQENHTTIDEERQDNVLAIPEDIDGKESKDHHTTDLDIDINLGEPKDHSVELSCSEEPQAEPSHISITSREETVSPQPEKVVEDHTESSDSHEKGEESESSNRNVHTPSPFSGFAPSMTKRILYSPIRAINAISSGVQKIGNVANRFIEVMDVADTPEQTDVDVGSDMPIEVNQSTDDVEDRFLDDKGDKSEDNQSNKINLEESETIQEKLNVFLQDATQDVDEPAIERSQDDDAKVEESIVDEMEVEEIEEVKVKEVEIQYVDEKPDTNDKSKEDNPPGVDNNLQEEKISPPTEEIEKYESHTHNSNDIIDSQVVTSKIETYNVSTLVNEGLKEEEGAAEDEVTGDKDKIDVSEVTDNSQESDGVNNEAIPASVQDLPRSSVIDAVNKLSELAKDIDENTTVFAPELAVTSDSPQENSKQLSSFQVIQKDDESELADFPMTNIMEETSEKNEASVASMVASTMIITTPNESSPIIDINTEHQQVDEGTNDVASHSHRSNELPTDPPTEEEEEEKIEEKVENEEEDIPISGHEQTSDPETGSIPAKPVSSIDDKPAKNVKKNNKRKQKQKSTRANKKRKTPITSSQSNSPSRSRPESAKGTNKKAKRGGARGPARKKK